MNRLESQNSVASQDPALARLVEEAAGRLLRGEPVDAEALAAEHPEYADELRAVLPAVLAMRDFSRSGDSVPWGPGDSDLQGTLGDYRILREVGRGGMGVVYEVEQISLGRRVALKVLPFAATMDPKQLQRFHNEAKAAASLRHEHIVHVYGVGCERGVHYYAMEFIDGQTLAQYIHWLRSGGPPAAISGATPDAARGPAAATAPVAALSTERGGPKGREFYRTAAGLIAQAADALEHAHSLGIVHRDVKPANLLMDGAGKLYVADFGLARFGSDAGLTMSGDLLGTLRYMAPEQALARHGLVDHRADVYGLGCTLYELLTSRPAVDATDRADILRRIAFEEPTPPRTLDRAIPAELETVTLKALAKEPAERYATAGELAADLRRWLGGQTIKARPPSLRQRLDKWARRHSSAVVAAVAALLVGTAVSTWQAVRAWNAEHRAAGVAAIATAVKNFLQDDLLNLVDTRLQFDKGFRPNPDLTVRATLDRAAARIDERFRDQPLVEAEIRFTIGMAYRSVREPAPAIAHLEKVVELRKVHLGPGHRDTLTGVLSLAGAYENAGRLDVALGLHSAWMELFQAGFGTDGPDATTYLHPHAVRSYHAGNIDDAERLMRAVLDIKRKTDLRMHTADALNWMSRIHSRQKKYVTAEAEAREALTIMEQLTEVYPWARYDTLSVLGGALVGQGKYAEAEPLLLKGHEGLAERDAILGPLPWNWRKAEGIEWIVWLYEAINQPEKARTWRAKLLADRPADRR